MQSHSEFTQALATSWQALLAFSDHREAIFGEATRHLLERHAEDRLPHPGFVGPAYAPGGILFLALNPSAGKDGHDPAEMPHYRLLEALKGASPEEVVPAFRRLMDYDAFWYPAIQIFRTMVIPFLARQSLDLSRVAYLNILKWRTNTDRAFKTLGQLSVAAHTWDQVRLVNPGAIGILGVKSRDILMSCPGFWQEFGDRCVTIPRSIGDTYVKPEAEQALRDLSARLGAVGRPAPSAPPVPILVKRAGAR